MYCCDCSYPLKPSAFEEIKTNEELRISNLEKKHEQNLNSLKSEIAQQFTMVFEMLQQHPELAYIKPDILKKKSS